MKTVSVIIPCYRDSATLERAIKSVLTQSYPAIEIVVVNDCSPESEEIEKIIAHYPQITYLRNQSNLGLAGSRNVGITKARGDYIALLDADDEYHPEKIATQIAAAEPGLVLTCGVTHVYADGHRQKSRFAKLGPRIFTKPEQIIFRNTINGAGILIERDLLLLHGCYDTSLRSCEDFDLWLRLLLNKIRIKDVGQPLYFYYANPAGLSKNLLNISKWEAEAISRHANRVGSTWLQSLDGVLVGFIWSLRHIMRCELQMNTELNRQVLINIDRLVRPVYLRVVLKIFHRFHILFLPIQVLRIFYRGRS